MSLTILNLEVLVSSDDDEINSKSSSNKRNNNNKKHGCRRRGSNNTKRRHHQKPIVLHDTDQMTTMEKRLCNELEQVHILETSVRELNTNGEELLNFLSEDAQLEEIEISHWFAGMTPLEMKALKKLETKSRKYYKHHHHQK